MTAKKEPLRCKYHANVLRRFRDYKVAYNFAKLARKPKF